MDGASGVLVIILGITLAIFLVLAVVLMILLIRVTQQIKNITDTAERTVTKMESAAGNVSKLTNPLTVVSILRKTLFRKKR